MVVAIMVGLGKNGNSVGIGNIVMVIVFVVTKDGYTVMVVLVLAMVEETL